MQLDEKIELSGWERLCGIGWLRKTAVVAALAALWQIYAMWLDNALMFPTFGDTVKAFFSAIASGELPSRTVNSLRMLLLAYAIGAAAAIALTIVAIGTRIGNDILEVLVAMLNPLAPVALLPLALLWFGLGAPSIVFVLIHAVLWALTLNIYSGFTGVSQTLRMVGRNYGLKGLKFVFLILIPAALPSILTGLKVSWAFGWRTLIAAELVFGVSSGSGGIGWFIFEKKNQLDIDLVFAGLLTVIIIGILVENVLFKTIEKRTVQKWGMRH
ncbi:MAG: ABC transporter permease subunit [Candidatus Accumulibacter sp.]|jgi:NitT/TauT family transport system permease protein|nr:ABC transporter permease subunit [Accumulibacter sp.]